MADVHSKEIRSYNMSKRKIPVFLMNDQPTVCGYCGARCEHVANFMHTNAHMSLLRCLNPDCQFIFFEEEDEEYLRLWNII
jgi:hypothetical protein